MKRVILSCSVGLMLYASAPLAAQTLNMSYENPGSDLYAGLSVLPASSGDIYMTSNDDVTLPAEAAYITHTDNMGNLIKTVRIEDVNWRGKLIETSDGGILFASYQHSNAQLGIFRFDAALNLIWSKFVPIGIAQGPITHRVDISTVPQSDTDHYLISCASATYLTPYVNDDAAISLIYIDKNGNLMWHKKYIDMNRAGSGFSSIRDLPNTISSIPVSGGSKRFLVGGMREDFVVLGHRALFFLMVDQVGNVITPYVQVNTAGANPEYPYVVNDTKTFTCAFRDAGTSISGDPNNNSGIGAMKFLPSLAINSIRYLWQPQISELYSYGLTTNSTGDFLISCHADVGAPNAFESPALLKLNAATLQPSIYKRYNIQHNTGKINGFIAVDGSDYAYLTATPLTTATQPTRKLRLIRASITGDACGSVGYPINYVDYQPSLHNYTYTAKTFNEIHDQSPNIHEVFFNTDVCDPANNPGTYSTKVALPGAGDFIMSPTLLDAPQQSVQLSFHADSDAPITIRISNSLGQLLHQQQEAVSRGPVQLTLTPGNWTWASGLNIVQVFSKGRPIYTGKVIRR